MPVEQVVFGVQKLTLTPYGGGTAVVLNNPEDFTVDVSATIEELYGGIKPWMIAAGVKDLKGKISGSSATLSLDALRLLTGASSITTVGSPEVNTLNFANTNLPQYFAATCRIQLADGEVVTYHFNKVLVTSYKIGGKRGTFTMMDFNAIILTDGVTGNVGYVEQRTVSGQVTP